MIQYSKIRFTKKEITSVSNTLRKGWISEGKKTSDFEKLFALKLGVKKNSTIAVSSCTAALELILKSLCLKKKDEVLMPSLTFVADANSVINAGGKPVFVDINSKYDLNIDVRDLEKKINKNTKAVIIVHYAGFPCDIKKILSLKKKYKFFLIEDSCHALFSRLNDKKLGSFGDASVFSFYSNKNMTTAEGGMIYSKDVNTFKKLKKMKNHGITKSLMERHNKLPGYDVILSGNNYRFDDIRASIGLIQLRDLEKKNKIRKRIAKRYISLIEKHKLNIILPFKKFIKDQVSHHLFVIILKNNINRNKVFKNLIKQKIFLSYHYTPLHDLKFYRKNYRLKKLDKIKDKLISLPIHPYLKFEEQKKIILSLKKILNN